MPEFYRATESKPTIGATPVSRAIVEPGHHARCLRRSIGEPLRELGREAHRRRDLRKGHADALVLEQFRARMIGRKTRPDALEHLARIDRVGLPPDRIDAPLPL